MISGILHRYSEKLRWRTILAEYGPRTNCSIAGIAGAKKET